MRCWCGMAGRSSCATQIWPDMATIDFIGSAHYCHRRPTQPPPLPPPPPPPPRPPPSPTTTSSSSSKIATTTTPPVPPPPPQPSDDSRLKYMTTHRQHLPLLPLHVCCRPGLAWTPTPSHESTRRCFPDCKLTQCWLSRCRFSFRTRSWTSANASRTRVPARKCK